jgi:hypothetical protein
MKKKVSKITALAVAGLFGVSTWVGAHHLDAPINVTCPIVGDEIQVNWEDVMDATKYSVHVVATYDTGVIGDPADDSSIDYDFGTGDRTDGFPMDQSDLIILLSALVYDFGEGPLPANYAQLRVKGLHPGRNQDRQNNYFSDFCVPTVE